MFICAPAGRHDMTAGAMATRALVAVFASAAFIFLMVVFIIVVMFLLWDDCGGWNLWEERMLWERWEEWD